MGYFRIQTALPILTCCLLLTLAGCGSEDSGTDDDYDVDVPDVNNQEPNQEPNNQEPNNQEPGDPDDITQCDVDLPAPPEGERCVVEAGTNGYTLLQGTVLAGDDVYENGAVLLDDRGTNKLIECTGCDCAQESAAAEATVVSCPDAVISPGLINPHDHLTYAEGRPQLHEGERYDHRNDWRLGVRDSTELNTTPRTGGSREVVLWGEMRMLMGGATSIAGSTGFTDASGLLRNMDQPFDTEGLEDIDVDYRTFPLGDAGFSGFPTSGCGYPNMDSESRVEDGIYLPHIAEGVDAAAQNEIHCLLGDGGPRLITENTSLMHGIAANARDIAQIADRNAKLVWSARTNIDLYGETARAPLYDRFGVTIALGTDWSTSGSMNMLRELQCVDQLNTDYYDSYFSDKQLWEMATINGAIALGAGDQVGVIEEGYVGDITLFDASERDAYRAVLEADIDEVIMVMRGGEPLYGDATLIEDLVDANDAEQCEFIDVCERDRRACVELDTGHTLDELQDGIHPNSYPLFFCGEPEDEPTCTPFRPDEYDGIPSDTDATGDGVDDDVDNCPAIFNPIRPMDGGVQADTNESGMGDICDPCPLSGDPECEAFDPNDWSGDGHPNDEDVCPFHYNPDQTDTSGDGIGDACSPCPDHFLEDGSPCPSTIYDIKRGDVGEGESTQISGALVTAVAPGTGAFVQVHPDDTIYEGPEDSGLYVYLANAGLSSGDFPEPGDRVDVVGSINVFFSQIQLADVTDFDITDSGDPLPEPLLVDPSDIATDGPLQWEYEGSLVTVEDVTVTNTNPPPGAGESEAIDEFVIDGGLYVNNFFHSADPFPEEGDPLESITGVLRWANGRSRIEPRNADDIIYGPPEIESLSPDKAYLEVGDSPVDTLTVHLDRDTEEELSIDLSYSDGDVISGPDSVDIPAGEDSATVALQGLQAQPDPVIVEATDGELTVSAQVRVYDDATERVLQDFGRDRQAFFAGDTVTLSAQLNVPADSDTTVDLDLPGDHDHTIADTLTIPAGERSADIDLELGDDLGIYAIYATLGDTTLAYAFEVFEPTETFMETFENFSTSGSTYQDGSFTGDQGFEWDYFEARQATPGGTAPSIDGTSMILRDTSAALIGLDIPGGLSELSFQLKQAFTGAGGRQVEVLVNDEVIGTSPSFEGQNEIIDVDFSDLDISGSFDLEIRPTTDRQVTIDNLQWTSGLPVDPDDYEVPGPSIDEWSDTQGFLDATGDPQSPVELSLTSAAIETTTVAIDYSDTDAVDGPSELVFQPGDTTQPLELSADDAAADPITVTASLDGDTAEVELIVFDDDTPRQIASFERCPTALLSAPVAIDASIDIPAGEQGFEVPVSVTPESALGTDDPMLSFAPGERHASTELDITDATSVEIEVDTGDDTSTVTVEVVDASAPFSEDFSLISGAGGSYDDDSFEGNQGFLWSYVEAQSTSQYAIDDTSMVLRNTSSSFGIDDLPGGLQNFSVDMRKAFTSNAPRQLELEINGQVVATSETFGETDGADDEVFTFEAQDLGIECVDNLTLRPTEDNQITIDNLSWDPKDG